MKRKGKRLLGVLLGALLLLPGCSPAEELIPEGSPTPTPEPEWVDTARLDRGVVSVRYEDPDGGRLKVQLTREGGEPYNYDLNSQGDWEVFPLTEGDGTYTLKVLEQIQGTRYRTVHSRSLKLNLEDPLAPFLEPSKILWYTADSAAVALAEELTAGAERDVEKTGLLFDYVVDHVTYDEELAESVEPGYLPDVDRVLEEGTGICYDYAALLAVMLRSQGIPCRLVMGDTAGEYHAWVEVWCEEAGEIDGEIPVEAGEWTLLDPTFLSTGGRTGRIFELVTDQANYTPRYVY